jgi:hypothetical protein
LGVMLDQFDWTLITSYDRFIWAIALLEIMEEEGKTGLVQDATDMKSLFGCKYRNEIGNPYDH